MIDDFADVTVANTCVFWDVEDFPIPDGHDPESVYQIIKSVIANEGYRGKVDIWAYGEKNKIRDEFLLAGITFVPEGETMIGRGNNRGDGNAKLNKYIQINSSPSPSPSSVPVPIPVKTTSRYFSMAKIGVFWDVEDCPVPHGHDPISVYKIVESTLANEGYHDETMEIRVYGGKKNEISEKLQWKYLYAGVYYPVEVPEGTCERVDRMLRDILIWTLDHPEPSNLMVIAKNISKHTRFRRVLETLKSRDHNVLFVQPDLLSSGMLRPFVRSVWLWKSLFDGGKSVEQSRSSQCVDNTSACSDQSRSSQGVANKRERKKRRKSRADTDSKV